MTGREAIGGHQSMSVVVAIGGAKGTMTLHSPASRGPQSEGVAAAGISSGRMDQTRVRLCCPAIARLCVIIPRL